MAQDFETLREEVERLRQENVELRLRNDHLLGVDAQRQATLESLHAQMELLREQIALLRKALFSPRRERFVPSPDQLLLFQPEALGGETPAADEEASSDDASSAAEALDEPPPPKVRKTARRRFEFPQCLPTKRIEYPLTPEELAALYGEGAWRIVKEVVTRSLEYVPPSACVLEEVRFVYGRDNAQELDAPLIVTSEKPASINAKGVFSSGTIAYLAESKFERHLPLYRLQEDLQAATTMWFNRSVLCGALLRAAKGLQPLRDLMLAMILKSFYLRADETTGRVLRPGTGKTELIYLWIYLGDPTHPYCVFDYRKDRSRAGPAAILENYRGGLLTDGYSVYSSLTSASHERLVDLGCWAHARRKFDEACVVTTHRLAHEALAWIGQLYDLEDQVAEATCEARREARERVAVPILNQLKIRLVESQSSVRPSLKLGEAIGYLLNRWDAMTRYTNDGRYPIDNNATERLLRPCVTGRKNFMFFGSDDGGQAACTWYTIIQSARAHNVHVFPYLQDVLVRVPKIVPEYLRVGAAETPFEALSPSQREALAKLLPDRWLKDHPQHRSEDRQRELDDANKRRRKRRAIRRRAVKA